MIPLFLIRGASLSIIGPEYSYLNNLEFDHGDIFRDLEDISQKFFSCFNELCLEMDLFLRNGDDENIRALPDTPWCQTFSVGMGKNNDLRIVQFSEGRRRGSV